MRKRDKSAIVNRVWEIDFLRGVCILMMVMDHFMFDLWYFPYFVSNYYEVDNAFVEKVVTFASNYWNWSVREAVRLAIIFTFLLRCSFSRSNPKRVLKLTAAAVILSAATIIIDFIMDAGVSIYFGILCILAASLGIYMLLKLTWDNKYFYLAVGILIIAAGLCIDFFYVEYRSEVTLKNIIDSAIGLCYLGADSYGIVPYTGIFLVGAFIGETLYKDRRSALPFLDGKWARPVEFVGRNTIWVYLVHQPVILGVVLLVGLCLGYKIF